MIPEYPRRRRAPSKQNEIVELRMVPKSSIDEAIADGFFDGNLQLALRAVIRSEEEIEREKAQQDEQELARRALGPASGDRR
jgi:hypothetical protein